MRPPSPKITNSHLAIMANYRPSPPLERLHEVLILDSSSPSGLRWKVAKGRRVKTGSVAGTLRGDGYWYIKIDKKLFLAHRIVYFMHHGVDPGENQVDHKNGDKSDNSINNLRLVDRSINMRNTRLRTNNSLGLRGVRKMKDCRRTKPYESHIQLSPGKRMSKCFETLEEAIEQRKAWEQELFPDVYLRED